MINPTAKDIDRKVALVNPFTFEGCAISAGRIIEFGGDVVRVSLGEGFEGAFKRDELEWFSGKDRE